MSEHFQIFAIVYKVENYHNIVWYVKYELWMTHDGLKMREQIVSRSKFQLKTWVLLNIGKIMRIKGMFLAKRSTNLFAIFGGRALNIS